jgi:hypothetical protein
MLDMITEMLDDSSALMLSLLVFLSTAVLAFGIMIAVRARRDQAARGRNCRVLRRGRRAAIAAQQ